MNWLKNTVVLTSLVIPMSLHTVSAAEAPASKPTPFKSTLGATDRVTYDNTIGELVKAQCSECHGSDSPTMEEFKKDPEKYKKDKIGPRADSYESLMVMVNGSDTGALMRRLDDGTHTKDGKPGNMYKKLGEDEAERAANLALFKRWIGGWSLKKAKEITEEELKAILAPQS